ncbi:MAG: hypothetical protein R3D29_14195 [Nitratireductor sp.]
MMIVNASKFQLTDIVIMGIILIGVIGHGIDILMRIAETGLCRGRVADNGPAYFKPATYLPVKAA